jgi:hypothetical protein
MSYHGTQEAANDVCMGKRERYFDRNLMVRVGAYPDGHWSPAGLRRIRIGTDPAEAALHAVEADCARGRFWAKIILV